MDISASHSKLTGRIQVPGSKSHTIRSLVLALLADGVSVIENPLAGEDALSTIECIKLFGAKVDSDSGVWRVESNRNNLHLPHDVVNVGNSGSALYFLAPLAAVFSGWSVFTGDESIRKRPVSHLTDALNQLGAEAFTTRKETDAPPIIIHGGITKNTVLTDGALSQYISGIMMASMLLPHKISLTLTNPKETPFLTMTQERLRGIGYQAKISSDFKHIELPGSHSYAGFTNITPSDWEAAAFPLVAAFITDSTLTISNIDTSETQGDKAVAGILEQMGALIEVDGTDLTIRGRIKIKTKTGASANSEIRVNISGFPDALPALSIAALFFDGITLLADAAVCRKKETDRISAMENALRSLGVRVETTADSMLIHGLGEKAAAVLGSAPEASLVIDSLGDHRIAMSFLTLGLALPPEKKLIVRNAECCAVSFPDFVRNMKDCGAVLQ